MDAPQLKFYHFRQNNSGGSFDVNDNVNVHVLIQAHSASEANGRAEEIGIYFDGVEDGCDCDCCGDRWYRASEDDGELFPHFHGGRIEDMEKRDDLVIHYYPKG